MSLIILINLLKRFLFSICWVYCYIIIFKSFYERYQSRTFQPLSHKHIQAEPTYRLNWEGNLFLSKIVESVMQEVVSEIMSNQVVTIDPSKTALDAALLMKEKRISSLIVQDNDQLLGIITERDFVKRVCADNKKSSDVQITELMSKIQTFAAPDTPVDVAVQRMINNRIRRLPVISNGKVVGIITVTDLAKELRRIMLTQGIIELID